MRLMKEPLPLLFLLLLPAAAAELNSQRALGTPALHGSRPKDQYRMKLCGREFIRAVIFICGGSRWKRRPETSRAVEQLLRGGASAGFLQSDSDKGIMEITLQSVLDPKLEELQIGQQPLKNLFNFYGSYNAYVPISDNLSEYIHQIENAVQQSRGGPGLAKLMKSNNFPWLKSTRRKRDYSMGVAEMCCKLGCTKTEVGRLC